MTEAEWLQSVSPPQMLAFLGPGLSDRKRRFFLLACCQELWGRSAHDATQVALASVEWLAESGQRWSQQIQVSSGQAVIDCGASDPLGPIEVPARWGLVRKVPASALPSTLTSILERMACAVDPLWRADWLADALLREGLSLERQGDLLRDVVRAPFRSLLFCAGWRSNNASCAAQVAQTIYDEQAFEHLPILADALEDAGCDCLEVLAHLRGPGPHVRGCWVVDLLLNRD